MSEELLKALGRVARADRAEADVESNAASPIDDDTRNRLADRALAELATGSTKSSSSKRLRIIVPAVAASGLALAAALFLWIGSPKNALPGYEVAVQGSTREWRGEENGPQRKLQVRADGTIEILARPQTPVAFPVEARAFAMHDTTTKTLPVDVSSQGVARVAGNVREIFSMPAHGPEEWRVVIIVGERGTIASLPPDAASSDLRRTEVVVLVTPN